jgi:tRNA-dihydrouridine synthase
MSQKKLAREIISAVCENTNLPVSIKIRAGVKNLTAVDFIKNTCDLPYSAIMIHGRTYEGSFSGNVDFSICEEIKKIVPGKIVLANGGINTPQDAADVMKKYPILDGLGIARGAWGKPFIFNQIKELLLTRRDAIDHVSTGVYDIYDFPKIKKIMLEHAKMIHKDKGKSGLLEIRKHMCWYVSGFPGAAELRKKLVAASSIAEIGAILKCA